MVAIFAGYRKWAKHHAVKIFKATLPDTLTSVSDSQMVAHSIVLCNKAIISGIECMLSLSAMESCRNNRVFDTLYSGYDVFRTNGTDTPGNEYLNHIWVAGLKITEIMRGIAVSTEMPLTEREKTDMAEVRDYMMELSNTISRSHADNTEIRSGASKAKELVYTHIRRHSNSMNLNDYNDGSVRYRYLRLLHNLYSYFLSMQKIA